MLSYDIVCQWMIYLWQYVLAHDFSSHFKIKLSTDSELHFVTLKYHLWDHKGNDHNKFSLNYTYGVDRMDGEEVERNWWHHNAVASSTHEMDLGSCHDILEDYFGWSNFVKKITLGMFTLRLMYYVLFLLPKYTSDAHRSQLPKVVEAW